MSRRPENSCAYLHQIAFAFLALVFLSGAKGCQNTRGVLGKNNPVSSEGRLVNTKESLAALKTLTDKDDFLRGLEKAVVEHPTDLSIKFQLAEAYMDLMRFEQAADVYRIVYKLHPVRPYDVQAMFGEIEANHRLAQRINKDCETTFYQKTMDLCMAFLTQNCGIHSVDEPENLDRLKEARVPVEMVANIKRIYKTNYDELIDNLESRFKYHLRCTADRPQEIRSAEHILGQLENQYLPQDPNLKNRLLYLNCVLARYKKNVVHAQELLEKVFKDCTDTLYIVKSVGCLEPLLNVSPDSEINDKASQKQYMASSKKLILGDIPSVTELLKKDKEVASDADEWYTS